MQRKRIKENSGNDGLVNHHRRYSYGHRFIYSLCLDKYVYFELLKDCLSTSMELAVFNVCLSLFVQELANYFSSHRKF